MQPVIGLALVRHVDLGGHGARDLRTPETNHQGLERVGQGIHRLGRLVAAMGHAVGAFLIAARAVAVPVGLLHELAEGLGVAFAEQVAGLLPAEDIAGRHAPGGAHIFLIAGEKIEEQRRVRQQPFLALTAPEDLAEQLLGVAAIEEVVLIGSPLIGVARRDRNVHPKLGGEIEEGGDLSGAWPSKMVALALTWKPAALAALIAEIARSNTPCWHTARSWCSRNPSRWMEKNR